MQTVNISLPRSLAKMVDSVVSDEGYASRSEFIRALVRYYLMSAKEGKIELLTFRKLPLKTIEEDLELSGRYNKKFVSSIVSGLSKSSLYARRKAIKS